MSNTREQFLETTRLLLEAQGFHATGLNQIVAESGAPKGSLYYHFPDGKDGLAAEALKQAGERVAQRIRERLTDFDDPAEAIEAFVGFIADAVEKSDYRSGGPITTVAMETAATNERLNHVCREAFQRIQHAFIEYLVTHGIPAERASTLAEFITASIEGGTILSRTYHSGDPLRRVATELALHIRLQT